MVEKLERINCPRDERGVRSRGLSSVGAEQTLQNREAGHAVVLGPECEHDQWMNIVVVTRPGERPKIYDFVVSGEIAEELLSEGQDHVELLDLLVQTGEK